jgi:hypothetical protein
LEPKRLNEVWLTWSSSGGGSKKQQYQQHECVSLQDACMLSCSARCQSTSYWQAQHSFCHNKTNGRYQARAAQGPAARKHMRTKLH